MQKTAPRLAHYRLCTIICFVGRHSNEASIGIGQDIQTIQGLMSLGTNCSGVGRFLCNCNCKEIVPRQNSHLKNYNQFA